ncbi:orotidine-5'-phosphate decarboxylase [Microbacterium terricola]|uniref:Orotidine-5'-phosphate decarboxylase n=1 Tax=Microbacterium terricola TaxID=344163 RepID=A0ABM8DY83_9MICO|nr:orotidine-5'-phosphate decarboxylase [Microbacterium terricola]UYK38736.1 orotidine-5'-phosphate decarboxylase [Microbacterium terricola]BDV30574.1 orotidine 5'-phosphate decarboxylase [Microbacterium terricola]
MTVSDPVGGFGTRLRARLDEFGPLCVGIDPHEHLLAEWGMDASAAGVREFGLRVVEAAAGRVAVVKPQVSFFERFGSAGFAALEEILAAARAADLLVVADAKRGDIGTTMDGYAAAWLTPGAPLEADALTVSPYLGPDSLRGTIAHAMRAGKGLFVLAATSNPEGFGLQSAEVTIAEAQRGQTVADWVTHGVAWANGRAAFGEGLGSIGLVVGATVDREAVGLTDAALRGAPILAPGFGAQGARPADLARIFGSHAPNVLASESRSILSAGPDGLVDAIHISQNEYRSTRA